MARLPLRRVRNGALLLAVTGLGLGFLAGFTLRTLIGDVDRARLRLWLGRRRHIPTPSLSPRTVAERIETALRREPDLASLGLAVVPARRGHVELHGWVPNRATSARALRLATEAAPSVVVTNRLLVRGEDDLVPEPPMTEERRPA
jgi:hypothetical protein